ncbi:hypothetical protein SLEP1_g30958 [Rubroshorea leprosula]|uniref:Uncharacterized protein n=1 Tax=Rubroshorea leprosula TaxID=152421 RepID=A0AAV5K7K0_9ROSI|nr:hypothetical protein SLEP1_g30958 [Rubroshorea leprosula]
MKKGEIQGEKMKNCELCEGAAGIYCESDQASLCWTVTEKCMARTFWWQSTRGVFSATPVKVAEFVYEISLVYGVFALLFWVSLVV